MSLDSLLESTGTLYRQTTGRDLAMGTSQDPFVLRGKTKYVCTAKDVSCSVQQMSASTIEMYRQKKMDVNTTIYFDEDIDPQVTDRFEVTDSRGKTFAFLVQGFPRGLFERDLSPYQMIALEIR